MDNSSSIPFVKMEGAGNDFVVFDNRNGRFSLDRLVALAPDLCDRNFGIGADGILALEKPSLPGLDYSMVYRNADGSDAGMCGNGSRCLALYAAELGLGLGKKLTFNVHNQTYQAEIRDNGHVVVSFPIETTVRPVKDDLTVLYQTHTGTEHVVCEVAESTLEDEKLLLYEGRRLREHPQFLPKGTNVNFIHGKGPVFLRLQTYERGVENLTLACGTGAIASALVWHHLQKSKTEQNSYSVATKGGTLIIRFSFNPGVPSYYNIKLEGPAHFVFQGFFYE